jgi:hypothetical protein
LTLLGFLRSWGMDLLPFEPYFERAKEVCVGILISPKTGDEALDIGTGTLVTIGGTVFVLTAGHNVWNADARELNAIAVGRPPDSVIVLIHPGDGSAGRVYVRRPEKAGDYPEPDVAVVELTERTLVASACKPFSEDDVGFFDTNVMTPMRDGAYGRDVVVTGFPGYMVTVEKGAPVGRSDRPSIGSPLLSMKVASIPAVNKERFDGKEPLEGRGLHVLLSPVAQDQGDTEIPFKGPHGMSGGPAIEPKEGGALVGLLRGVVRYEGAWDAWYEPAAEAVRLLVDHSDARVAAAALRVCDRYDRERANAVAVPTIPKGTSVEFSWSKPKAV